MSKSSSQDLQVVDNPDKLINENNDQTKQVNNPRTGKVITNALCTLIQVSENINTRLQTIQNATDEINLLRQEVIEMNKKLNRLLELAEKSSGDKSTFFNYLTS
jgi:ABC-type transporter Mla subunit MlaD